MEPKNKIDSEIKFENQRFYFLAMMALCFIMLGVFVNSPYRVLLLTTGIILTLIIFLVGIYKSLIVIKDPKILFVMIFFSIIMLVVSIYFILFINGFLSSNEFIPLMNNVINNISRGFKINH